MGGSDIPEQKPNTINGAFSGVKQSTISLPGYGGATSGIKGSKKKGTATQYTDINLDPGLSQVVDQGKQGILANQGFINLSPTQQLQQLDQGQNSFYNLQSELNNRQMATNQAEARQRYSASGLDNSTIAGAMEASVLNDATLRDLATRQSSIESQNALAGNNIGINQGLLGDVYGYGTGLGGTTNQNFMTIGHQQDQVAQFNAQMQAAADQMNRQIAEQNRQRSPVRALSFLSPAVGFATGNADASIQGLMSTAQMASMFAGGGGGPKFVGA